MRVDPGVHMHSTDSRARSANGRASGHVSLEPRIQHGHRPPSLETRSTDVFGTSRFGYMRTWLPHAARHRAVERATPSSPRSLGYAYRFAQASDHTNNDGKNVRGHPTMNDAGCWGIVCWLIWKESFACTASIITASTRHLGIVQAYVIDYRSVLCRRNSACRSCGQVLFACTSSQGGNRRK